jgi:hypothetical protein
MWIDVVLRTCMHRLVFGSAEHFLPVGRKSGLDLIAFAFAEIDFITIFNVATFLEKLL